MIRAVDHELAPGVHPDMTEHGWERDDWPAIFEQVMGSDIVVLLSPIWLGEKSSLCTRVIERLRSPRPGTRGRHRASRIEVTHVQAGPLVTSMSAGFHPNRAMHEARAAARLPSVDHAT